MTLENAPKILLIDDDRDFLDLTAHQLSLLGVQVECVSESLSLLKPAFRAKMSEADAIVSDLRMPSFDGESLLKFLREQNVFVPVIMLTADDSIESAVTLVRSGAFDYLTKPLDIDKLHAAIRRACKVSHLEKENSRLRNELEKSSKNAVVCISPEMKQIELLVNRVAKSRANILITGESGSGKEVVARQLHDRSDQPNTPFIAINCSAIPEALLESELFGHAKGSFTGAVEKKVGLFEEANGGTLFLDEIGDLSLPLQVKLLRVLQDRKIKRVGENQYRPINVALIAATHKNLENEIREGRFREDLFYRLNVIPIKIPALRERLDDILPLAQHFISKLALRYQKNVKGLTKEAKDFCLKQQWLGNVRELENTLERAVVLSDGEWIDVQDLPQQTANTRAEITPQEDKKEPVSSQQSPFSFSGLKDDWPTLHEVNLQYIDRVLQYCGGVKERAAHILDVDRKTLYRRVNEIESQKKLAQSLPSP